MKTVKAQWPAKYRTADAAKAAYAYVAIIVIMTVAQLFSFEKFMPLLESFGLPGEAWATVLVVCGVLAVPFLLRMKLSTAMRWVSMVAGWIVAVGWLIITVWVNVAVPGVENMGLLGASVPLLPGWWAVFVVAGMGVLAAWASWGLWPGRRPLEPKRQK